MFEKKITFDSFIRGIISGTIIIGILYVVNYLSNVLLPFFIAWLIAYLIYPIVIFFQEKLRLKNRALSISVTLLLLLGVIVLIITGLIPPIVEEFGKLKGLVNTYLINGDKQIVNGMIADFLKEHIDLSQLKEALDGEKLAETMQRLLPKVWGLLSHSVSLVFSILASFIILLYTFFILLDYETISHGWVNLVPIKHRKATVTIINDVKDSMNRYFRGQAVVAFSVGILFSIGFLLIDFPLAIGFGLFIGLLNMVPYLQLIALIPTVLLALLKAADTGENFWWILACAILVFCVVQIIQDGYIVPKVMGKITGLNPAIILLSLSIWGALMGVIGMIIALPCTSLLLSYYRRYINRSERLHLTKLKVADNQGKRKKQKK